MTRGVIFQQSFLLGHLAGLSELDQEGLLVSFVCGFPKRYETSLEFEHNCEQVKF